MVRTSKKAILWTFIKIPAKNFSIFWGQKLCFFLVKREMPILLFVKCEMTVLFPVKRDQYQPLYHPLTTEKKIQLPWIVSLAIQASCKQNINDSGPP